MPKRLLSSFFSNFIEEHQKSIVMLLLLITVIGGIVGYRYYRHTQEDPEFCASCHLMKDAFKTWQMSKHRDFQCQTCHAMSLLEQNKLLVSFVVKGTERIKQSHGRIKPWSSCRKCHFSETAQGSVTTTKAYGHAKHVFMQNISCSKCHIGNLHNFVPDQQACSECHKDRMIHGLGMEGLACLNCHSYAEKEPKMVSDKRCLRCHKDMPRSETMASLHCFDCHHPHGEIQPSNMDCFQNCHSTEARVGQHQLHMTEAKMNCLDCHKAHVWTVGKKEAVNLCNRCHPIKDPDTFIY